MQAGFPAAHPESGALMRALAAHPEEMATLIGALHQRIHNADALLNLMGRVSREAVRLLDGVAWAGITAGLDGTPFTAAHTDARVLIVDEGQYTERDGPCLQAMRTGVPVAVTAAQLAQRWPRLAGTAQHQGVGAVLAMPLQANGQFVGALNLYSADQQVPTPDPDYLTVLTQYISRGLTDFQDTSPNPSPAEVLRRAATQQLTVHQAIGILMQLHGSDSDHSWQVLNDQAQDWNRTIPEQAVQIIADHTPTD